MILPALPLLIPLFSIFALLVTLKQTRQQKIISSISAGLLLAVSVFLLFKVQDHGPVVMQLGGWKAPYGISIVVDLLSALMLTATSFVSCIIVLYSFGCIDTKMERAGYYPLMFGLLAGVNGAFTTGDIFNLYVWYEVMLTASFVLIVIGSSRDQLGSGIKYLTINFLASVFFVAAIGILYGMVGSLNMAAIADSLRDAQPVPYINGVCMLFIIAFCIKGALFPFFFWLPASYHTPPMVVTALFSATLTKVAIYTLIRFQGLYLFSETAFWKPFFLVIAGLTMVIGVLMAASQFDMRKILSFHIISQVGYMVMGMGLATIGGLAGGIFFMLHNVFSKTSLFLVTGTVYQRSKSYELSELGGYYYSVPYQTLQFFIPALALAGVPPLPGFFGKFFLIKSGFEAGDYLIISLAIFVGLVTLFSMIKIWNEVYWKKEPEGMKKDPVSWQSSLATSCLVLGVILLGVFAGPVIGLCEKAAVQILEPDHYIEAVLGR